MRTYESISHSESLELAGKLLAAAVGRHRINGDNTILVDRRLVRLSSVVDEAEFELGCEVLQKTCGVGIKRLGLTDVWTLPAAVRETFTPDFIADACEDMAELDRTVAEVRHDRATDAAAR